MKWLVLLFLLVPAIELAILIQIGSHIGTLPTLALILSTGVLGAFLARMQGLSVLRAAQEQMQRGELPSGALADGVLILVAGALLITPGVLTDAAGFLLLVPQVRHGIKGLLLRRLRRAFEQRQIQIQVVGFGDSPGNGSIYDLQREGEPFEPLESDPAEAPSMPDATAKYTIH